MNKQAMDEVFNSAATRKLFETHMQGCNYGYEETKDAALHFIAGHRAGFDECDRIRKRVAALTQPKAESFSRSQVQGLIMMLLGGSGLKEDHSRAMVHRLFDLYDSNEEVKALIEATTAEIPR